MFDDNADLPNLVMVGMGIDPATSTPGRLAGRGRPADTSRRTTGSSGSTSTQNYTSALQNGDVALTMAWSGDIFQLNLEGDATGLQFCDPERRRDHLDRQHVHPASASRTRWTPSRYMDYVYQPRRPGRDRVLRELHLPGARRPKDVIDPDARRQPADLPDRGGPRRRRTRTTSSRRRTSWTSGTRSSSPSTRAEPEPRAPGRGSAEHAVGRRDRQGGHPAHRAAEAQPAQEARALRAAGARRALPRDLLPDPDRLHVLHVAAVGVHRRLPLQLALRELLERHQAVRRHLRAIADLRGHRDGARAPARVSGGLLDRVLRRAAQVGIPLPAPAAVLRVVHHPHGAVAVPADGRRPDPRVRSSGSACCRRTTTCWARRSP